MGLTEKQKAYIATVPKSYRKTLERAYLSERCPTQVKAKCLDCVGFEEAPVRIRECTCEICPIWKGRPYQKSEVKSK